MRVKPLVFQSPLLVSNERSADWEERFLGSACLFDETSYKPSTIEGFGQQVLAALGEVVAELQRTRVWHTW